MNRSWCDYQWRGQYRDRMATAGCFCTGIFNHTSLCEFYQGKLLLHLTIPFEEKPKTNLPSDNTSMEIGTSGQGNTMLTQ